jgi:hypothetical protein
VAIAKWLAASDYQAIPISDIARIDDELIATPFEALVVDVTLVPGTDDLSSLVRFLGPNRPVVVLGDAHRLPSAARGDLSVIARPLTSTGVLLAVGLALAEGRPSRRAPRKPVGAIPASAHGMTATVLEASALGVGIQLASARSASLPPYFKLRIPHLGVHVVVKRAWRASAAAHSTRCGGTVEGDLPDATRPWSEFARAAADTSVSPARRFNP